MIADIIKFIQGKIFFILSDDEVGTTYFVKNCKFINGKFKFNDAVTDIEYNINVDNLSITTYADNTIPLQKDLDEFSEKGYDIDFFKNIDDHNQNNNEIEEIISICKSYIEYFDDSDAMVIKFNVYSNNTSDLDKLKILGYKKPVLFRNVNFTEQREITNLYWKLIENKLKNALDEIDSSIDESDEEFKKEAEIIKHDLKNNVDDFKTNIKAVSFEKLFHHWPTLLNPSPFGNV